MLQVCTECLAAMDNAKKSKGREEEDDVEVIRANSILVL
jgi:hypothetical protein